MENLRTIENLDQALAYSSRWLEIIHKPLSIKKRASGSSRRASIILPNT
jgi:hypothetical protein